MSGFMEILVVVAIVLGIILLPRRLSRQQDNTVRNQGKSAGLTGWTRLSLFASIVWPAFLAFYLRPWEAHWPVFLCLAFGPVAVIWGVFWVISGFREKER